MKLLPETLDEVLTEAPRRGGGRASLGFDIPEESPGYGRDSKAAQIDSFRDALEEVGCEIIGSNSDGEFHFRFPGLPAIATVVLKLFEV